MDDIVLDAEGNPVVPLSVLLESLTNAEPQFPGLVFYVGDGTEDRGDPPKTMTIF